MENTKLLFRASGVGVLTTKDKSAGLTLKQEKLLQDLIDKAKKGITLTAKQASDYKIYKAKQSATPKLSDGARTWLKEMWILNNKGIQKEIQSKYLDKGNYAEREATKLLIDVDGTYYKNNTERKDNGVLTGLPDIIKVDKKGKRIVIDTKCSWDVFTFMNAKMSVNYEWQGRVYMELFNCEEFQLRYCLVDCPEHIYLYELYKFKLSKNIIDEDTPESKLLIANFRKGFIYSDNPAFTKEERVKTFTIQRDDKKMEFLYDQIKLAIEYYQTITLNMVV